MDKKLQAAFSLASDGVTRDDDRSYSDMEKAFKGKTLASIFSQNHANLTAVVLFMMEVYELQLAVATPFLDNDHKYLKTGEYDYETCEMVNVSSMLVCSAGSVEQVLVAALQIYFSNGKHSVSGTDCTICYFNNAKEQQCIVTIDFKFNGVKAVVKLDQVRDWMCISIYIDD